MFDFDEFSFEEAFNYSGSFAVLGTISILAPYLGLMSKTLRGVLVETVSMPVLFIFLIEAVVDRNIDYRKNILLIFLMSYFLHIVKNLDVIYNQLVNVHLTFILAFAIAVIIVSLYYLFHVSLDNLERIVPGKQRTSKRFSFIFAYIPSLMVSIVILYMFNILGIL